MSFFGLGHLDIGDNFFMVDGFDIVLIMSDWDMMGLDVCCVGATVSGIGIVIVAFKD